MLNKRDGTLDTWIQERCKQVGVDIADPNEDWGGLFGAFFSGKEEFTEQEAAAIFSDAVAFNEAIHEDFSE